MERSWSPFLKQSSGQDRIERIDFEGARYCLWSGGVLSDESRFSFRPPDDAREFVNQLLSFAGLAQRGIVVRTANVGNAVAMVREKNRRYIFFSSGFIEDLRAKSGSDWAAKTVFAHELGHHLNQHLLAEDADRQIQELEADTYSGHVLCRLGATLEEARKAFTVPGAVETATHPAPAARLEAVTQGWRETKKQGDCGHPPPAPPVKLFASDRELTIDATNVEEHMSKGQISADKIVLDDVTFSADREIVFLSNRLEFQGAARLVGPAINIVTAELVGGFVDASGGEGEAGGEIFIAAGSIDGTTIRAAGGNGGKGKDGAPGADGPPGVNGRNGRCGPGMFNEFVGSTNGGAGGDGGRGGDGEPGGAGCRGGRVLLLTVGEPGIVPDVSGGPGGKGGAGGLGGRGGQGGRGGAGCAGLGGTQPTRPNGPNGRLGPSGSPGDDGDSGPAGSVWRQSLESLATVSEVLDGNMTTEEEILQLRIMVRRQPGDGSSEKEVR